MAEQGSGYSKLPFCTIMLYFHLFDPFLSFKVIWDQNVEPYKADNARLVRENNELHQQIMKEKEEFENQVRYLKANLRRIEHENTDLKFLNTQYVQKLRALEKDSQIKSEKILELQEKNFQAVIHTPGGREKKIPFRRQRMDVDCFVPPGGVPVVQPLPQPDPYVADLLKVADERIAEAQSLLQEKDKHLKTMENNIQDLRRQVRPVVCPNRRSTWREQAQC